MPPNAPPDREAIIRALTEALRPLAYVRAFWEGGAAAYHRVDAWSDLDLYVVVDDDRLPDAFPAVEGALRTLAPIERKYEVPWPAESGIAQAFYRLQGASPYLLVDLAVMKASAPDKFLEPELHGPAVFYLNPSGLTPPALDLEAFLAKLKGRLDRLRTRFDLFAMFVDKELNRGNSLEALDAYQVMVFDPLVEVLRMRHGPFHYAFRMRYVHYEFPQDVVRRLERLAFVRDAADLEAKSAEAGAWFRETAGSIDLERIRSELRTRAPATR